MVVFPALLPPIMQMRIEGLEQERTWKSNSSPKLTTAAWRTPALGVADIQLDVASSINTTNAATGKASRRLCTAACKTLTRRHKRCQVSSQKPRRESRQPQEGHLRICTHSSSWWATQKQ